MTAKKIISNLLLGFVLISIGVAIGKETAQSEPRPASAEASATTQPTKSEKVLVYYMHQTFRCVTCNQIEAMAHNVVKTDFASEVANGTIEWRAENFQKNEELAKRYNVVSSSVVVARVKDGKEIAHETLDGVWTLVDKPTDFREYVASAVRAQLGLEVVQ